MTVQRFITVVHAEQVHTTSVAEFKACLSDYERPPSDCEIRSLDPVALPMAHESSLHASPPAYEIDCIQVLLNQQSRKCRAYTVLRSPASTDCE